MRTYGDNDHSHVIFASDTAVRTRLLAVLVSVLVSADNKKTGK